MTAAKPSSVVPVESDLPEGWTQARISEFALTQSGGTPSTSRRDYWDRGDVPWINSGALKDEVIRQPTTYITKLGLESSSAKLFPLKTVLIALTGATTGKVGLLDFECSTNQSVTGIFPSPVFVPEYLFYFLRSARGQVLDLTIGSAQPHINKQIVDAFQVPLPPLAEQKRVVAKVDELLARVNTARERLARVPAILKRFRQAVLVAACSGHLTSRTRIIDETADQKQVDAETELLEVAGLEELPVSWAVLALEKLCDRARPITYGVLKPGPHVPDGVPLLRIVDIASRSLTETAVHRISRGLSQQYKRTILRGGEILVSLVGTIGRVARVPLTLAGANIHRNLGLVTPGKEIIPDFLYYAMASPIVQRQIEHLTSGANQPLFNLADLRRLAVPVAPLAEQQEIVRRVEALFKLADAIEKRIAAATARAEKLTQAILAKAFRGELVPTEAELARREGRPYEPASALLARIRSRSTCAPHLRTASRRRLKL